MWLLVAAGLDAHAGTARETPLCRDIQVSLGSGARKQDVASLLREAQLSAADISCLQRADLPSYVARKAQRRLVKEGGLQSLPTGPVEVWALVPDPCAIVGTQSSVLGLFGQAICEIDLTGLISDQVASYIESQAQEALDARGIEGTVSLRALTLPVMEGVSWESSAPRVNAVSAGLHHVLHVRLPDAVAAARALKGDFLVGIGARRGIDVESVVREELRKQIWSQLAAYHIPSVLVELDE